MSAGMKRKVLPWKQFNNEPRRFYPMFTNVSKHPSLLSAGVVLFGLINARKCTLEKNENLTIWVKTKLDDRTDVYELLYTQSAESIANELHYLVKELGLELTTVYGQTHKPYASD